MDKIFLCFLLFLSTSTFAKPGLAPSGTDWYAQKSLIPYYNSWDISKEYLKEGWHSSFYSSLTYYTLPTTIPVSAAVNIVYQDHLIPEMDCNYALAENYNLIAIKNDFTDDEIARIKAKFTKKEITRTAPGSAIAYYITETTYSCDTHADNLEKCSWS